jgi:hypothetical protein
MNKSSLPGYISIRSKEIFGFEHFQDHILHNLQSRMLKSSGGRPRITYDINHSEMNTNNPNASYFCPAGILCQRIVKAPWMIAKSRSSQRKYWFNAVNQQSVFECPQEAMINFQAAFSERYDTPITYNGLAHSHNVRKKLVPQTKLVPRILPLTISLLLFLGSFGIGTTE